MLAVLPHGNEMLILASVGIFVMRRPEFLMSSALRQIAATRFA